MNEYTISTAKDFSIGNKSINVKISKSNLEAEANIEIVVNYQISFRGTVIEKINLSEMEFQEIWRIVNESVENINKIIELIGP